MKNLILLMSGMFLGYFISNGSALQRKPIAESQEEPQEQEFNVEATMYYPVSGQTDSDPDVTADGSKIDIPHASRHKWIAVSRNLLKRWGGPFNYGDKVLISGAGHKNGVYEIHDTMNRRFKNRIDFLETNGTKMYKFDDVRMKKTKQNT